MEEKTESLPVKDVPVSVQDSSQDDDEVENEEEEKDEAEEEEDEDELENSEDSQILKMSKRIDFLQEKVKTQSTIIALLGLVLCLVSLASLIVLVFFVKPG